MARTDWSKYGIKPTGNEQTRQFRVTTEHGVDVGERHYAKGETVPRRQAENLRLAVDRGPWQSWAELQSARAGRGRFRDFPGWVRAGESEGKSVRGLRKPDSELSKAYVAWVRAGRPRGRSVGRKGEKRRVAGAQSKLAKLLVASGKRPSGATYPVGGSPKRKGK